MSGEYYLLNALWIGALCFIVASYVPFILRVAWRVLVLLTPFGIVAAVSLSRDAIAIIKREMEEPPQESKGKG